MQRNHIFKGIFHFYFCYFVRSAASKLISSLDELDAAIKPTGFSVIRQPGLTPRIRHPKPPTIVHIVPESTVDVYFEATLPQNFFEHIVHKTNLRYRNAPGGPITLQEIRKWLGTTVTLMILRLRSHRDLFSTTNIVIKYPLKENALSRNRWSWINSHLQYDEKILQSILINTWQFHFIPGTFVTVDEHRTPCHPRDTSLLSFNNNKPDRWAQESHTLNDTKSSYLYNFDLPKQYPSHKSLHKLTRCLRGKRRYHITADNHFSNLPQAQKLARRKFYFTLNCKRNAQPSLVWKGGLGRGLPKHRSRFARHGSIIAATFHSNAKLNILSNFFIAQELSKSIGKDRGVLLQHYDATKRGADQFNLLVKNFHNHHSHSTPQLSLLNSWIQWGLTNGYILYKTNTQQPLTHRQYLSAISQYLLM